MTTSFETGWPDVQTTNTLGDWLRFAMKRDHLTSARAVARYTGLSPDAVTRILHGGQPERSTVEKLAKKFPGEYRTIMVLAGFFPPDAKAEALGGIIPETVLNIATEEEIDDALELVEGMTFEERRELAKELDWENSGVILVPVQPSRVSAGQGTYSDIESIPYIPRSYEYGHRFVAVVITGDCLAPDVLPGWTVIVDRDASWQHGNTVVAVHDGEMLAKLLEKRNGDFWLVARQGRDPIKVDESTNILGVVRWIGHEP